LESKTETVEGDPLMYSVNNKNGGKVVVSIDEIDSSSFINTLNHYNSSGQNITILTGTHGCPEGGSIMVKEIQTKKWSFLRWILYNQRHEKNVYRRV